MLPDFSRLTIGTAAPKRNLSEVDGEGGEGGPDMPTWADELLQEFEDKEEAQKEAPARAAAAKAAEENEPARMMAVRAKIAAKEAAAKVKEDREKAARATKLARERALQAADDMRRDAAEKLKDATADSFLKARRAVERAVKAGSSAAMVEILKQAAEKAEKRNRKAWNTWNEEWGPYAMSMKPARVYTLMRDRQ